MAGGCFTTKKRKERREDDDRSYDSQPDTAASSKALDNEAAHRPCGCSSSCGRLSTAHARREMESAEYALGSHQGKHSSARRVATRLTARVEMK
jgi:hypothetical protein